MIVSKCLFSQCIVSSTDEQLKRLIFFGLKFLDFVIREGAYFKPFSAEKHFYRSAM